MIYILDEKPELTAQYLDDRSLDRMIKAIAQVLCNVHHFTRIDHPEQRLYVIPLDGKERMPIDGYIDKFSLWGEQCIANYRCLVGLGLACVAEDFYRALNDNYGNRISVKYERVIEWARDNEPDLPVKNKKYIDHFNDGEIEFIEDNEPTSIPLVMPKKHIYKCPCCLRTQIIECVIKSYRNYYRAKLPPQNLNCKDKYCGATGLHNNPNHYYPNPKAPTWTRRSKPEWL